MGIGVRVAAIAGCLFGTQAWAGTGFVETDHPVFGTESVNEDVRTGLKWLDIGVGVGLSYNDVVNAMAPGGPLEGWRVAEESEVDDLWRNTFGLNASSTDEDIKAAVDAAGEVFGFTVEVGVDPTIELVERALIGVHAASGAGFHSLARYEYTENSIGVTGVAQVQSGTRDDNVASASSGTWVVLDPSSGADCPDGDDDGDGVCNDADACFGGDSLLGQVDMDGNGVCDVQLVASAMHANAPMAFRVQGPPAGANVFVFASVSGPGAGICAPGFPNTCLDIKDAFAIASGTVEDIDGILLSFDVPSAPVGLSVSFQVGWFDPVANVAGESDVMTQAIAP